MSWRQQKAKKTALCPGYSSGWVVVLMKGVHWRALQQLNAKAASGNQAAELVTALGEFGHQHDNSGGGEIFRDEPEHSGDLALT